MTCKDCAAAGEVEARLREALLFYTGPSMNDGTPEAEAALRLHKSHA